MTILTRCKTLWQNMSVANRKKLLEEMNAAMEHAEKIWDDVPHWVLANIPDFDSLPSDLCGHLMLSITPSAFDAQKLETSLALITGNDRSKKDTCVLCREETPYAKNTPAAIRKWYIEGAGQVCEKCFELLT